MVCFSNVSFAIAADRGWLPLGAGTMVPRIAPKSLGLHCVYFVTFEPIRGKWLTVAGLMKRRAPNFSPGGAKALALVDR